MMNFQNSLVGIEGFIKESNIRTVYGVCIDFILNVFKSKHHSVLTNIFQHKWGMGIVA